MTPYLFLLPVFNDWASLALLIKEIDNELKKKGRIGEIIIVNDCSTERDTLSKKKFTSIKNIRTINLNKNIGSQKAIFLGLKFIKKKNYNTILTILDSDGEDNPRMINKLINIAQKKEDFIIVANRSKRNENKFLILLNKIRLLMTYLLTGKYINFGNFSSFDTKNLAKILSNNNLWFAYSSGILKNFKNIIYVNIDKKKRYFGQSKVNFKFLLNHSAQIICVFIKEIFIKSLFIIPLIAILFKNNQYLLQIIIFLLFLNLFFGIYYFVNNLNFNVLKIIKNIKQIYIKK